MSIGTRAGVAVVICSTALAAGCGGGSGGAMSVTLNDGGCAYSGDTTPPAGCSTIEVENATQYASAFAVASLADGATIETLQPLLERAADEFEQKGTLPNPPAFYEQVVRTGVAPESSGELPADLSPGTYALVCFVDDPPNWRAYAATQLDVGG